MSYDHKYASGFNSFRVDFPFKLLCMLVSLENLLLGLFCTVTPLIKSVLYSDLSTGAHFIQYRKLLLLVGVSAV